MSDLNGVADKQKNRTMLALPIRELFNVLKPCRTNVDFNEKKLDFIEI